MCNWVNGKIVIGTTWQRANATRWKFGRRKSNDKQDVKMKLMEIVDAMTRMIEVNTEKCRRKRCRSTPEQPLFAWIYIFEKSRNAMFSVSPEIVEFNASSSRRHLSCFTVTDARSVDNVLVSLRAQPNDMSILMQNMNDLLSASAQH